MRVLFEIITDRADRPGARRVHRAADDWRGGKFHIPPREPSDDFLWERMRLDVGHGVSGVLIAGAPEATGRQEQLGGLIGNAAERDLACRGEVSYFIGLNRDETDLGLYLGVGLVACAVARLVDGVVVDWLAGTVRSEVGARSCFRPEAFRISDHVSLRATSEDRSSGLRLQTHGMAKLGCPDLELRHVPQALLEPASELVLVAARYGLSTPLNPGETMLLGPALLQLEDVPLASSVRWRQGLLRLLGAETETGETPSSEQIIHEVLAASAERG